MTKKKDAKLIGMELANWMGKNGYSVSDIYRGLIPLINSGKGNIRVEGRSSILGHPRKPTSTDSMECAT